MAKLKPTVTRERLSHSEIARLVRDYKTMADEIADLEKQKKKISETLCNDLGAKGNAIVGLIQCTVVQAWYRTIPWKELAIGLAKELFNKVGMRQWLRGLAKTYPKKPKSAFLKLTLAKGTDEEGPTVVHRGGPLATAGKNGVL